MNSKYLIIFGLGVAVIAVGGAGFLLLNNQPIEPVNEIPANDQVGEEKKEQPLVMEEEEPGQEKMEKAENDESKKLAIIPSSHTVSKDAIFGKYLLFFSPDGNRVAYSVKDGGKEFLVVNGQEGKRYSDLWAPVFSPDGSRLAYGATENSLTFMVIDGQERKEYYEARNPTFSPNSKKFAYSAGVSEEFAVVDGKKSEKQYNDVKSLAFSPDSTQFAYVGVEGDSFLGREETKALVILNGQEGKRYDEIWEPFFSPDGKQLAYAGKQNEKWFLVFHNQGVQGKPYDFVWNVRFSPIGGEISYSASEAGKEFVVQNGRESIKYERVTTPVYSPDGKQLAYAATLDPDLKSWFLVLNGTQQQKYDLVTSSIAFSPDSKKVAYTAVRGSKEFIVVNERELQEYDQVFNPIFVSNNKIVYGAQKGEELWRIVESI